MILIVTFLIFALTLTSVSAADLNATSDEITAIDNGEGLNVENSFGRWIYTITIDKDKSE